MKIICGEDVLYEEKPATEDEAPRVPPESVETIVYPDL
jgi:hypothetical protein